MVKNLPGSEGAAEDVGSILGQEDPLEEEMATHSSILVWSFPWTRGACHVIIHRVAKNRKRLLACLLHYLFAPKSFFIF